MKRRAWSRVWPIISIGWTVPTCICDRVASMLIPRGFCLHDNMRRNEIMLLCNGNFFVVVKARDYDMDGKAYVQIIIEDDEDSDPALVAMLSALA
jgi:hypothetical protein